MSQMKWFRFALAFSGQFSFQMASETISVQVVISANQLSFLLPISQDSTSSGLTNYKHHLGQFFTRRVF